MCADDTHRTYASNNIQTSFNEDLVNVHNWLTANKLTLNMTKTEFVLIGSRQRLSTVTVSPTLVINDFRVTQVTTAKSLGVIMTIDDNLDWGSHMEKIFQFQFFFSISISILFARKNLKDNKESIFWHRGHKASKAPCPPSDLTTNLPSSYTPSLQLLQYCLGKLWDNLKEQTSKTTK